MKMLSVPFTMAALAAFTAQVDSKTCKTKKENVK